MKLVAVIEQSGFASESTFFRTFKAVTGLSPKEWLAQKAIPTATDNLA
jgi:AraC-like DNA-binding protein